MKRLLKYETESPESDDDESSFDLSVGDLMAGLLMMFALLLSVTLLNLQREFEEKSNIAERYQNLQVALYEDLYEEFENDLDDWGAEIDEATLSVRFQEPRVLFEPNSADVKRDFESILQDFFPRYIEIVTQEAYRDHIEEIRIEGHTANPFNQFSSVQGYLAGIDLSQERTNNVLAYVMRLDSTQDNRGWIEARITANGLSHSRPILDEEGNPDWQRSRRVDFRLRTDAEEQIRELLEVAETAESS